MGEFIDLHCHCVPGIDDGVRTIGDSITMLRMLADVGFGRVIATPHMCTGAYDNDRLSIQRAFALLLPHVVSSDVHTSLDLASEHYLDDVVFRRIMSGEGLPYPGGRAVLLEWGRDRLPLKLMDRLFDIRCRGMRPVIAHPERYRACWTDMSVMESLVDGGAVLLMNIGSVAGEYGSGVRIAAERMLDAGLYYAACTDAHRLSDIDYVVEGIERMRSLVGAKECEFMLRDGPLRVLAGNAD